MHEDDVLPYQSRSQLFETIRQQRIQLDQKDDQIRNLTERLEAWERAFDPLAEHVEAGRWEPTE